MKQTLALFFVLPIFAMGCQSATVQKTPDEQQSPTVTDQTVVQPEVKHYSDGTLSFDYPGDLLIFETSHGEGSSGHELTFIQPDKSGVYTSAGPLIAVEESENSPTHEEKYNQDLKDAGEFAQVLNFTGAQAFEMAVTNDFSGDSYKTLEFIFDNLSYDPSSSNKWFSPYYFATFSPLSSISNGKRYQEILDMFEKTVRFN